MILTAKIAGIGVWGPGFNTWPQLQAGLLAERDLFADQLTENPKPDMIPPNERRRAPLPVKLAVATSESALLMSGLSAAAVSCVFASGYSDTELTDYMCRVLTTVDKPLSPTKFHNSVHNAPAGYWTISTNCTQPANSIAALDWTVTAALLEALSQCQAEQTPVLLTIYDTPVPATLQSIMPNDKTFAVALVLLPVNTETPALAELECTIVAAATDWPEINLPDTLTELYQVNPAARALTLLQVLAKLTAAAQPMLELPLSEQTTLNCKIRK